MVIEQKRYQASRPEPAGFDTDLFRSLEVSGIKVLAENIIPLVFIHFPGRTG